MQVVIHLSRTPTLNHVYLENLFPLVKDESCYGDIKNAQFCATTRHVVSCEWWKCIPT